MGHKNCRGLCELLPGVLKRPWWKPKLIGYLYCPSCKASFPDLGLYYKLDSKRRKTCLCCGTTLRTIPRRSKRWKFEAIYREQEAEEIDPELQEKIIREAILSRSTTFDHQNGE